MINSVENKYKTSISEWNKYEESGRIMKIKTDQKAVVCYSMNFPDELPLENGKVAKKHDGICFETQNLPVGYDDCFLDGIILKKDEEYYQKTTFKFECI